MQPISLLLRDLAALAILAGFLASPVRGRTSSQPDMTAPVRIDQGVIERTRHGVALVRTVRERGSGFFVRIGASIVCITNRHVVEKTLTADGPGRTRQIARVTVRTAAGRDINAVVWKSSVEQDIAILRLDELPPDLEPLDIEENPPKKGSPVFVWGAPYGEALVPLDGHVERVGPSMPHEFDGFSVELIHVRISIAPGHSGGPLLTPDGRVLGVIARRSEANGAGNGDGIAVASRVFWTLVRNFEVPASPLSSAPQPAPERPPDLLPVPPPPEANRFRYPLPQATATLYERAQTQSRQLPCRELLFLPPGLAVYTYRLTVRDMRMLRHLPDDSIRITEFRLQNPAILELAASTSADGTPTLVCVM